MQDRTKSKRGYEWTDSYLSDFLDTTTINGVIHVFRGRSNIRRLIWTIVFIGAIIGCIILIGLSVPNLINTPTATTITVVSSEENGLPFPAVTVCNLNIRRNLMISNETYRYLDFLFNADERFLLHLQGYNISFLVNSCQEQVTDPELQEVQIWETLMHTEDLIHYCGFVPGANAEVTSCTDDITPVLTPAGVCYTFNGIQTGQPDKIVTTTGANYGLKLILNIDQENHPSTDGTVGAKVIVHERDDIPRPNLYGINVSPGQNLEIGIQKHGHIDNTNKAHCIYDRDLEFFPANFEYSQFACRENSLLRHIADTCGCVLTPSFGPYADTRNCTFGDMCCLVREYAIYDQFTNCPLPCEFEMYQSEASYSTFPGGQFLNKLAASLHASTETVKDNFLSVHIFIDDLQVTSQITDYTYGPVSFLSNVGGLVGLFLGISIISIFEVLILLLDELKRICWTEKCSTICRKIDKYIPLPVVVQSELSDKTPTPSSVNIPATIEGSPRLPDEHSLPEDPPKDIHVQVHVPEHAQLKNLLTAPEDLHIHIPDPVHAPPKDLPTPPEDLLPTPSPEDLPKPLSEDLLLVLPENLPTQSLGELPTTPDALTMTLEALPMTAEGLPTPHAPEDNLPTPVPNQDLPVHELSEDLPSQGLPLYVSPENLPLPED